MRQLLHIGEVAQLLGVTPKTIRHYQKIGLLGEPERTEAGYRLYGAHDLLRLHRIRHLQTLGLSLKQIKAILGEPAHQRSLREVLQSLDEDITVQIQALEERHEKIRALLEQSELASAEHLPAVSPTLERTRELLGDLTSSISPVLWQQEAQMDTLIDAFRWPVEYQDKVELLLHYIVAHPEVYQRWIVWGERIAALATLPEDAPEVEQLLADCAISAEFAELQRQILALSEQVPHLEDRFAHVLSDLLSTVFSPAQRRFFEEMLRRTSSQGENK
jgi:DNA-binding transcriptional MerR regulator